MTGPQLGRTAPNAVAFVIAWQRPIFASPLQTGSKRWAAGGPLPYQMINRVTGGNDFVSDLPTIRLHVIAASETQVQREMDRAMARMMVLVEDPLTDVLMDDGSIANCEWAECTEGPRPDPPPYSSVMSTDPASAAVSRLCTTWNLSLRFANASPPLG